VLAIDAGFTLGYGAIGGGKPVTSGSIQLRGTARQMGVAGRDCDDIVRSLILAERPDVIAFASPFVGQTFSKPIIVNGQKIWGKGAPIPPDNIRPLMSFLTIIEMVCDELRIRCVEISESEARRAFMTAVPRKSKDIKLAVMRACRLRGWPFNSNHAADALCVASRALEILEPKTAHQTTPLFAVAPKRRARAK
jgi:hypothetical protein